MPRRIPIILAVLLASCLSSAIGHAYPWMIKHGYTSCSPCHDDPSGGELLTEYGRMISDELLSSRFGEPPPEEMTGAEPARQAFEPLWGLVTLPDTLQVGGSLRLATLLRPSQDEDKLKVFPMQIDAYGRLRFATHFFVGGSLGLAKVPAGSPHARSAQITTNQGDAYNLISRTHYLGWSFGEGGNQVRVGRLNLPFGVRLSEHTLWTREQTQTDRESDQQHGVALFMEFARGRFEAMAIAGNYQVNPDRLRERGYAAYGEWYAWEGAALGFSTLFTVARDDLLNPIDKRTIRQVNGASLRLALDESVVVMAEADVMFRSRRNPGYVGFAQVDFEPLRGLHWIGTVELLDAGAAEHDRDSDAAGLGKPKLGAWLGAQWFFATHFDARIDAIFRHSEPVQLLAQIHVYP